MLRRDISHSLALTGVRDGWSRELFFAANFLRRPQIPVAARIYSRIDTKIPKWNDIQLMAYISWRIDRLRRLLPAVSRIQSTRRHQKRFASGICRRLLWETQSASSVRDANHTKHALAASRDGNRVYSCLDSSFAAQCER